VLKAIAGNIKDFAGDWDSVWDNIMLRAKTKETLVNEADKAGRPELLEAPFVIKCNDMFHNVSEKVKQETGSLDSKKIFLEWNEWLKREMRKKVETTSEETK